MTRSRHDWRALAASVLITLSCTACATVGTAPTDPRLVEAQKAFDEGKRLEEAGQHAEAVAPAERALELREAALGRAHPEVARCLNLLAVVHTSRQNYVLAEQLHHRALAIREVAFGKKHPDVAASLNNLGALYRQRGDYARAEPLYQRALAIWEATLGSSHLHVGASLHNLATIYRQQGNYARAEPLLQRAFTIYETTLGKNHPDVASSLNNLAGLHYEQGHYTQAEPLYQRALAIREEVLGKSHPAIADSLNNLATFYVRQGHYTRAEPLYQRALTIRKEALGKNHSLVADSLGNLAALYEIQGHYARAEPLYQRTLEIRESVFDKNHPDIADSLRNLADISGRQGHYERARLLYERALAILEAVHGKSHPSVADLQHNLAAVYMNQGEYKQAELLLQRALAIQEATHGSSHPDIATPLHNLATLYRAQGDYARAEPLYARALAILEAAHDSNHPDIANLLHDFANLHRDRGDHAKAEQLYGRALAILETLLDKKHPQVARVLQNYARLRLAQEHLSEALPLLERAFTIAEEHLRQEVYGFSEERLTSVLHLLRTDEELLYALVRAHPDNTRLRHLALSAALLRKGRSIEEIAETSRIIYRSLDQADRDAFEHLRALRTQFARLSLARRNTLAPDDHRQNLKELTDKIEALESDIARRSAPLRALFALPPPAELVERVAASLPSDGALVEFVAYDDSPFIPKSDIPRFSSPSELRYLALVLFADGRTWALDLGPAAPIDRAAQRLHDALANNDDSYQSSARALHALVLRRLLPVLGKKQRLFLSPDSQLSLIPFAALHDGRQFLIDDFDITYLTSGKDLLPRSDGISPAQSVVVLADPDFGSQPATGSRVARTEPVPAERSASLDLFFSKLRTNLANRPWPPSPLPGTRQEAETIHSLLPQAHILMGHAATKEALLSLATPGVLHIATHGFFAEDAKAMAATRMTDSFGEVGEVGPAQNLSDPLLRSGLVLASAHATETQSDTYLLEDSLVTALELSGLNLWGTQLVVLSACDTGRGDIKLGQGVYGLRRALMVAGAQTLVTSLWKVKDEETRQLMESYYRNLLAGQGRATALRSAMRTLRLKHPHPYFWAPFIAIGQDTPLLGVLPHTESRPTP